MQRPRPERKVIPVHLKHSQWREIAAAALQADEAVSEYIRNAALARVASQSTQRAAVPA